MENESTDHAPQPPIGREITVVVWGNTDPMHPIEAEIAEGALGAGHKHGLSVAAASGPYYSDGDDRDQKLAKVTAERDELRVQVAALTKLDESRSGAAQ